MDEPMDVQSPVPSVGVLKKSLGSCRNMIEPLKPTHPTFQGYTKQYRNMTEPLKPTDSSTMSGL
jgi:hypothetical protein